MSELAGREELAIRYLLGTLSEEERARLEERYFSDDSEFEELEMAEEELIDKYVCGELSKIDSDRFEKTLAGSPRLMERVQIARLFVERLKSTPAAVSATSPALKEPIRPREQASWWTTMFGVSSGPRAPRLAVAFSILLVLLGGLALLFGWLRLREESRRLALQQAALEQRQRELDKQAQDLRSQAEKLAKGVTPSPTPSETRQPKPSESPTPPSRSIFAMALSPGSLRSGGSGNQSFSIPSGTANVEITVRLRDADYPSYRATILTPDRVEIFHSGTLRPIRSSSGDVLFFRVPAKRLSPGDYSISVDGRTPTGSTESVDDYPFRVAK